jgi:hypothetical protein
MKDAAEYHPNMAACNVRGTWLIVIRDGIFLAASI